MLAASRLGDRSLREALLDADDDPEPLQGLSMVPLDKLDLQRMSIIYTTGGGARVTGE